MVTAIAAVGFVWLYETTALDSKYVARFATLRETTALPMPGSRLAFSASAYCKGLVTASGVAVQSGVAAADPELLPVGSVVEIDSLPQKYNGIYTVMDTGPAVQGRLLDLYMWSCNEALRFGRKDVQVTVLRLGWDPQASTPRLIDRLFRRREAARQIPPPEPPPPSGIAPEAGTSDRGTSGDAPVSPGADQPVAPPQ